MSDLINPVYFNPLSLLRNLRPRRLIPDLEVDSITDIDLSILKGEGVKGIIFDVDNTLCEYGCEEIDEKNKESFDKIRKEFRTCIISNTSPCRRAMLAKYFGVPAVLTVVKKPRPEPYREAMGILETSASETAMVGDRLLTDIAGANNLGMYSIKVKPVRLMSEPLPIVLARGFESFVLRFYEE